MIVREYTSEGEQMVDFEQAERIGSESIYPAPGVSLSASEVGNLDKLVEMLLEVDIEPEEFSDLDTFEQLFAALYAWKFKTMLRKQNDYGPDNITKAGERGIITRTQDKIERLKVLVGDEGRQVQQAKALYENNEPETLVEMNEFLNKLEAILFPVAQNESILDTWGDAGNYGDIGVTVHAGAWPKPLTKHTQ